MTWLSERRRGGGILGALGSHHTDCLRLFFGEPRAALASLPQHTVELPIACVEGWSTVETWTGVRLADLAAAAGRPTPGSAVVSSLERFGAFNHARLQRNQVLNPDALLAFRVNGADLSLDHGYPARVIVPALPGVHCTKWVKSLRFVPS